KRAVGGGVGQVGPAGPLVAVAQDSGPVDETGTTANTATGDVATSWVASVENLSHDVLDFKVFALCSARSDATIEAKAVPFTPGDVRSGTVTCPAGKRALGGGLGEPGAASSSPGESSRGEILQSGPIDERGSTLSTDSGDVARGWTASVVNGGPETHGYTVFAICSGDAAAGSPGSAAPQASGARCAGLKATIVGTAGPNTLRGTPGPDVIAGLGGNDTIAGGAGNDKLAGEAGNDTVVGGPGNDTLLGGPGMDRLNGGPGVNTVKP